MTTLLPAAPRAVLAAAALVAAEALATLGVGGWLLVETARQRPSGLALAVSSGVFLVLCGLGLGAAATGLARARRWSRAPALVAQLILLAIGYQLVNGAAASGTGPAGAVLIVAAVAAGVLLFVPSANAVLRRLPRDTDEDGD